MSTGFCCYLHLISMIIISILINLILAFELLSKHGEEDGEVNGAGGFL